MKISSLSDQILNGSFNALTKQDRFNTITQTTQYRPQLKYFNETLTEYTISGENTMTVGTLAHGFAAADAQFSFGFDFFEDANFREVQTDPTYQVGQQVNYGSKFLSKISRNNQTCLVIR